MPDMPETTRLPHAVREIENVFIPLRDGTRLAARIWLPVDAETRPVPAILEYLPYRKRDGTAPRDAETHPFFAGHGYASVRVDIRGTGESDGVLLDEYLELEQDDCLEVLEWLEAQPWCTGACGMIGISWGGFNGLQVAARRPKQLKAVISLCSTDDRYADDVHYMGGCLLVDNVAWGSTMFTLQSYAPDPALVGERWREMWRERLENHPLLVDNWLKHQRRDAYWRHGSVIENYGDITAAVYARGRLGRWLQQCRPAAAGGAQLPEEGAGRPLGPSLPPSRPSRPRHRIPPGVPALVGPVAEGRGHRHHGRARLSRLDGGLHAAGELPRRAAGPLGRRAFLAQQEHQDHADGLQHRPPWSLA